MQESTYIEGTLRSTFSFENQVPSQNGIPYPSFDPQERKRYSLEGTWKKKRFDADHNWTMSERTEAWLKQTEKQGYTKHDFNDQMWEEKVLPAPENHLTGKEEVHAAETYEDGVWYRKTFTWEQQLDQVVTLKCLGVSYVGDFWLNETYIGYHEGGFTPFAFDVSNVLTAGENTIAVRIDNPPWTTRLDTVPAVNNDFFNYTGIIQDVYLEMVPSVQVARVNVVPLNTSGDVQITYVLENRTQMEREVAIEPHVYQTDFRAPNWLHDPSAKSICTDEVTIDGLTVKTLTFQPGESKQLTETIHISNPEIWTIRAPHLYVLHLRILESGAAVDDFYTQFGIRSIATKDAQILLNEKQVFFAGVARHEEWPEYGRTAKWDRIVSDFRSISELHVNLVRTAHYPNHIETFIALDRFGLPSMSEIPLWQFETAHYEAQEVRGISYQMWREMIFSSYNRPSIVMWSTQNESKDVMLRKAYNEALVKEVKADYPDGRLLTQSAAADQPGFEDASMEPLDVAGWTMYFGIFHGSTPYEGTKDFIEKAHQVWPNKPIMNTEYGIWSNADKSFIEKQVEIYNDVQLALLEKATVTPDGEVNPNGYVATIDYWTAFDWYVNHNEFYQTMGMLHMDRKTRKPLYDHFVCDHKRLLGKTNGIATEVTQPPVSVSYSLLRNENNKLTFSLDQKEAFTHAHYLLFEMEFNQADPVIISLCSADQQSSYRTFTLSKKIAIPLWKFDESVREAVDAITIEFTAGQEINVTSIRLSQTGN